MLAIAACGSHRDPRDVAHAFDRADGTSLYTWLVEHEPSAVVTWNVPVDRIRRLIPRARIDAAATDDPCAQTARAHAALVVLLPHEHTSLERDRALDCGIALFRDERGLVIAPR